jgi:hypothetical protein
MWLIAQEVFIETTVCISKEFKIFLLSDVQNLRNMIVDNATKIHYIAYPYIGSNMEYNLKSIDYFLK